MTIHQPPGQPLKTIDALVERGLVAPARREALAEVAARYAVSVTPAVAALIDPADTADPIARQFVPDAAELRTLPEELADPIGDEAHSPVEGVVHRYPDRALLKLVHACPVYCRFCFRREMVGPGGDALTGEKLDAALAYLASRPEIWEVIMTGGDPLILSARRLREVGERLAAIPHIKVARWHSRVPMVQPERVTQDYARALRVPGKASYVAVHANHPRELDETVRTALARLAATGVTLLNQAVLLRGVNDSTTVLAELSEALFAARVLPYYLHLLDPVRGAAHFDVNETEASAIIKTLRRRLPGYLTPRLVREQPGQPAKTLVG